MNPLVTLEISERSLCDLIFITFERLSHEKSLTVESLREALQEVVDNILFHAYEDPNRFLIKVTFFISDTTIRIDVSDTGIPFDFSRFRSESLSIPPNHSKGFYRIYDLVDRFYFTNVAGIGKCFTLIDSIDPSVPFETQHTSPEFSKNTTIDDITVHCFRPENAEGISKLMYYNYEYTYYKAYYYDPDGIRHANTQEEILSIVAIDSKNDSVVGHFAMIPSKTSDIAEIGAAVVDPRYKQMGIMNRMFDYLMHLAQKNGLHGIYGEGMMLHPYSQKANLRHGMIESAIMLGEVPASMEIEHTIKNPRRSGVIIGYLLFKANTHLLHFPSRYRQMIEQTYRHGKVPLNGHDHTPSPFEDPIEYRFNPLLKTGTLALHEDVTPKRIDAVLNELLARHFDMIYADINLHRVAHIDSLVASLNERLFFYSGVMFRLHHNEDYLRLQRKNTLSIDEEQLICYSPFAQNLLTYIFEDEAAVISSRSF